MDKRTQKHFISSSDQRVSMIYLMAFELYVYVSSLQKFGIFGQHKIDGMEW